MAAAFLGAACSPQAGLQFGVPPSTTSRQIQESGRGDFVEKILYSFPLSPKKKNPIFPSSALFARFGSFFGATSDTAGFGGGTGAIFELTDKLKLETAARFRGKAGGAYPSGLVGDASGSLYGTTRQGGDKFCLPRLGCGTVFKLTRSRSSYVRSVLYRFTGGTDGIGPSGGLAIGANGDLYGTTVAGGMTDCASLGCGTVFRLRPVREHYREHILYRFRGDLDGSEPVSGVIADSNGNLFGVTAAGGDCADSGVGCGTVYELTRRGRTYSEVVLYRFAGTAKRDGAFPASPLVLSSDGTLYGTTRGGGIKICLQGCGTVFKLVPSRKSYKESVLAYFGPAPHKVARQPSGLLLSDGELYGTTELGGGQTDYYFPDGFGTAFKINAFTGKVTILHDFSGPPDGADPTGGLTIGPDGSLYGVTSRGGNGDCVFYTGCGTIYRLSPPRPAGPGAAQAEPH
ncbi:MAG: choice-of-anchor tandem repeat GloVer-containing protein [Candidatus Cybelea sp.]